MKNKEINLFWHEYKFFPYEKKFAIREIQSLLDPETIDIYEDRVVISGPKNYEEIKKLVYFSMASNGSGNVSTNQFFCENGNSKLIRHKRQNTRYSVHGLHEYKGKFNPQIVRSLFNIYNVSSNDIVLDPFCGSGTTLVEAAHDNISAKGTDINPLAVFIANTKIGALNINASDILVCKEKVFQQYYRIIDNLTLDFDTPRIQYLKNWFPEETLLQIEALRLSVLELEDSIKNVFLVIISNLLRDYSLQEPTDLRIRRRFSPFPDISLINQFSNSIDFFEANLMDFQNCFKPFKSNNLAVNVDIKQSKEIVDFKNDNSFDFAITSPPYATALPYIDTQRLSLIWLDFITPKEIKSLESELIGSREFNIKSEQQKWEKFMIANNFSLPVEVHSFCINLNSKLKPNEGFRKKSLPPLLYRYFNDMRLAFKEVHRLLKDDKYFCLVVGHNHTKIGGSRTDIDTPKLLSHIGVQVGFNIHEIIELEAYQRYGINSSNSVQKESLIVFKK